MAEKSDTMRMMEELARDFDLDDPDGSEVKRAIVSTNQVLSSHLTLANKQLFLIWRLLGLIAILLVVIGLVIWFR